MSPRLNHIARFDRLIQQNDDARHKVRHNLLQTKTKAHTNGTGQHRKTGQINPEGADTKKEGRAIERDLHTFDDQHLH